MIRIEIIANQSVHEEIIKNLEAVIPNFCYSLIPLVYGRGKNSYKLGSTTWPETNFILIAYCPETAETDIQTVIEYEKKKFPDEGIKIFVLHDKKPE
ncbi:MULTISPECIES: PG0541 family transporter-associated protein [unclassified Treponema]|uniref:PG0541 family transporter-associated protein n=1 Tax=unclassified Treponema TaxID=2638727 RepID=UPI0025CD1B02|nr:MULTISPECIES: PG0541 family transporter-associated protein [unclassified Treponema]